MFFAAHNPPHVSKANRVGPVVSNIASHNAQIIPALFAVRPPQHRPLLIDKTVHAALQRSAAASPMQSHLSTGPPAFE